MLIALGHPGGGAGQPGRTSQVDKGGALIWLTVIVKIGADDDIGIAIAVDVAGGRRRHTEFGSVLIHSAVQEGVLASPLAEPR